MIPGEHHVLADELHQSADHEERGDDGTQGKEEESGGDRSQHQQRDVRGSGRAAWTRAEIEKNRPSRAARAREFASIRAKMEAKAVHKMSPA